MRITAKLIGSAFLFLVLCCLFLVPGLTQAETIVKIEDLTERELRSVPFTVTRSGKVRIEATGGEYEPEAGMFAYPWVIDANSRALIWSMDDEITEEADDSEWLRTYDEKIRLHHGSYLLYYYSGPVSMSFRGVDFEDLSDLWDNIEELIGKLKESKGDKSVKIGIDTEDLEREYFVRLTGEDGLLQPEPHSTPGPEPAIAITAPENDTYEKVSFTVSEPTQIEIYAVGEYWSPSGAMTDWGWIADTKTGKHIWEMGYDNTSHAGGDEKNRRFRGRVKLPAGGYTAFFVTDGSHTFDGWNSAPPYDPEAWGLQIFPVSADDADHLSLQTSDVKTSMMIRLAGVGDNELVSGAFRLIEPSEVRIYAVGEYDRYSEAMADYAWVVSAGNNEKVWVMTGKNTVPAGGATKNRQYDGVMALEAGEYLVWYTSDGSHSYADGWNDSPPLDQKAYGITLSVIDHQIDTNVFVIVNPDEIRTRGALVDLTGLGNGVNIQQRFTLTSLARIRIHAIGEGYYRNMSDYGWIENTGTGDVVWEMTYRKTSHAGGAEKNREVDQTILLDKGEYTVHYVTDGSHSQGDWNSAPPRKPAAWGIQLRKSEKD